MRNTTSSSDPGGIVRTSTASSWARLTPPEAKRCPPGSTHAANSRKVAGITVWRLPAARARSRKYQLVGEPRTTIFIDAVPSGGERPLDYVWQELAKAVRAPCRDLQTSPRRD